MRTPKEIREAAGFATTKDAAKAAGDGMTRATVGRVERGEDVSLRTLRRLARVYGCARRDLLDGMERVEAESVS